MSQHRFVKGQLNVQYMIKARLAALFESMRAFECQRMCTADMIQGTGQIEGTGILAPFGLDLEQVTRWIGLPPGDVAITLTLPSVSFLRRVDKPVTSPTQNLGIFRSGILRSACP